MATFGRYVSMMIIQFQFSFLSGLVSQVLSLAAMQGFFILVGTNQLFQFRVCIEFSDYLLLLMRVCFKAV